ncbi:MAG: hypothetical protein KDD61_17740 [Bdellovibrionales bacterium]|nr:hypothetical protein [Bdellovibrionales bacterium]
MDELLVDFKSESKELVDQMLELLEEAEDDGLDVKLKLDEYGQLVDRIMGSATSLCMVVEDSRYLEKIGHYAEICKIVGYKGSQLENEQFFIVVVAMLLDATEMLQIMLKELGTTSERDLKDIITDTFLERLRFINSQFDENLRGTVATQGRDDANSSTQSQIDSLLAALGVG